MYIYIYTFFRFFSLIGHYNILNTVACKSLLVIYFIYSSGVLYLEYKELCPTLCNPMDYSLSGSSVHGDSPGKNAGVGCHALLQEIFPTQGLNSDLPQCKQTLYLLSHQGSPKILEWVAIHSSKDLPHSGIELGSPLLKVDSLAAELPGKPNSNHTLNFIHFRSLKQWLTVSLAWIAFSLISSYLNFSCLLRGLFLPETPLHVGKRVMSPFLLSIASTPYLSYVFSKILFCTSHFTSLNLHFFIYKLG